MIYVIHSNFSNTKFFKTLGWFLITVFLTFCDHEKLYSGTARTIEAQLK